MNLKNKIVLITGASSGIGAATAIRFAKEGAIIAINFLSNQEGAEKVKQEIESNGGKAEIFQADVSKESEAENLIKKVLETFGTLDILVNNAGIGNEEGFLKDDYIIWEELMKTNFLSTVNLSQHATKYFIDNKIEGLILNTSSTLGAEHNGNTDGIIYASTKSALNSFTKSLAKLNAKNNIRVNAVAPGVVRTKIWEGASEEEFQDFINQNQYLKREIEASEIADAFLFLAKNNAITGQIIYVDGGFSLK